ncbi:MAG TPA: serine--tRNA ligase, partial [Pseudomonadota bacterium]|nr:serine--tRNA ligase [Pseudomonadota bacterium]
MIDSKILRERPDEVLAIYRDRLFDEAAVTTAQEVLKVDAERRKLLAAADELKAKRNTAS